VQFTVCYNCAIAPINLMLLTTTSIKDCRFCLVNISFDRLFYSNFCANIIYFVIIFYRYRYFNYDSFILIYT
jgi:hypothetical protein